MEEQNVQLQDVNEPEVKFKLVSDKKVMNIVNADINEVLVQEKLTELAKLAYEEAKYMKKFLTRNLAKIVEECSSKENTNRKGQVISPAPLRSVAVSASKALMDMYPVKEAQKLSIEGGEEGGITFNVIMPEQKKDEQNND